EGRIVLSAKQLVELVEFAALPLPAEEASLFGIEDARAVEEEKPGSRALSVEFFDASSSELKQDPVLVRLFLVRVRKVGQKGEGEVFVGVRKTPHFEVVEQALYRRFVGEERRDDHDR